MREAVISGDKIPQVVELEVQVKRIVAKIKYISIQERIISNFREMDIALIDDKK